MPTVSISKNVLKDETELLDLLLQTKIIPSKAEGRRLIDQGGLYISENRITDIKALISIEDFVNNELIVKKGKKKYYRIIIES